MDMSRRFLKMAGILGMAAALAAGGAAAGTTTCTMSMSTTPTHRTATMWKQTESGYTEDQERFLKLHYHLESAQDYSAR